MMNTMHTLLGGWDYFVLALLGGTAFVILGAQTFIKSMAAAIKREP